MARKPKRFEVIESEAPDGGLMMMQTVILRDTVTGVLYLLGTYGEAGGITPLLGADGKPLVWREGEDLSSLWS